MKSFKKILSVFLAILCIFGMISTAVYAAGDILGGILGDDLTMEPDIDEKLYYGVHYEIDSLSGIQVMYKPNPDIEFQVPSKVKVTSDVPLSVDYECYAWRDEAGNLYYAGNDILVTGKITLYAVWKEKEDNDPRVIRVIKTSFQTLIATIKSFLGVFKVIGTPEEELTTKPVITTTVPPSTLPPETAPETTTQAPVVEDETTAEISEEETTAEISEEETTAEISGENGEVPTTDSPSSDYREFF